MGNQVVRYKAEVDFDGRELTRSYIDTLDLEMMLQVNENEGYFGLKNKADVSLYVRLK